MKTDDLQPLQAGLSEHWGGRNTLGLAWGIFHQFKNAQALKRDHLRCCSVGKSCLTLCNPMDCNLPGSCVHRISQKYWEYWSGLQFPSPEDFPDPGIEARLLHWQMYGFFITPWFQTALKEILLDFSGGPVGKEPVYQWRVRGFDPWSRKTPPATEQLSLCITATLSPSALDLCSATKKATALRSLCITIKSSPCLLQLEKAHAQQQRPSIPKITK